MSSAGTVAPDAPVTLHQSNRPASDTPVPYHRCNGSWSGEKQVSQDAPVMSSGSIRAITMLSLREPVKWREEISSAPDEPVVHQARHQCNFKTEAEDFFRTG